MKKIITLILFLSTGILYSQCLENENIRIERGIPYSQNAAGTLELTLVISQEQKTHKSLLILPDEYQKDPQYYECLAINIANSGITVAIAEYSQPPHFRHPQAINDILKAVEYLKKNDNRYGLELWGFGVIGQNFGGYLASQLGINHPDIFSMVGMINSPTYLPDFRSRYAYPYIYHAYFSKTPRGDKKYWETHSPINQVNDSVPAFLLMYGGLDSYVSPDYGEKFGNVLAELDVPYRLFIADSLSNGEFLRKDVVKKTSGIISTALKSWVVEIPDNISVTRNKVYASAKGRKLFLDIFKDSKSGQNNPAILLFHGGGGIWGRKNAMYNTASYLASKGIVAIPVEYRLAREEHLPVAIDDGKAAIRWVKAHADEYGIDPERIFVGGDSAGAYISLMLGVTTSSNYIQDQYGVTNQNAEIEGVVSISGIVDLVNLYSRDPLTPNILLTKSLFEDRDLYESYSPLYRYHKNKVEWLLLHATKDEVGILDEMEQFKEKIERSNGRVRLVVMEDGYHNFFFQPEFRQKSLNEIVQFISN